MQTTKLIISVQLEISDLNGEVLLGEPMLRRIAMNVEGAIDGTLRAQQINCGDVRAIVRHAGKD